MLEIIFLVRFVRHLSKLAKSKGRSGGWGALGVGLWFGGEISGLLVGAMADAGAAAYLVALLFAAVGATIAHFIVKSLRPADGLLELAGVQPAGAAAFVPAGPPDLSNPYAPPRAH
jgi:hypothetical protein